MDSHERSIKKKTRNNEFGGGKFFESIWLRYFGLQDDAINRGLLDYNAYIICVCGPILYLILSII